MNNENKNKDDEPSEIVMFFSKTRRTRMRFDNHYPVLSYRMTQTHTAHFPIMPVNKLQKRSRTYPSAPPFRNKTAKTYKTPSPVGGRGGLGVSSWSNEEIKKRITF